MTFPTFPTRTSIGDSKEIPNVAIFLKRTALEFLQILFSVREKGCLKFDLDDTKTDIRISDQHTTGLNTVDLLPAIIAVRGPISWQGMGLGKGAIESVNRGTQKITYNDLLTGSVAFSCISREGIEAENIAHLVFNSFKFFKQVLQSYGYFSIKSLSLGAETLVEQEGSEDKVYVVPVYVSALIQDRWSMEDTAARKLKEIVIETLIC